jgi:hypothetical protein
MNKVEGTSYTKFQIGFHTIILLVALTVIVTTLVNYKESSEQIFYILFGLFFILESSFKLVKLTKRLKISGK